MRGLRAAGVTVALLGAPLSAGAWHDVDPITDNTASVLNEGELRLGLFKVGYGITDWLQVETYTLPWFVRAATLSAKAVVWQPADWTLALEVGLLAFNPARLAGAEDQVDTPVSAIPLTAHATWQASPDWRWSLSAGYTATNVSADVSERDAEAAGAVSTGRFASSLEWRLGRVVALVLEGHLMVYESIRADASSTRQLDEDTEITLYGDTDVSLGEQVRGHATVSVWFSWEETNVRVGGGYGHYRVPMISYFIPEPTFVPELALFWRF